MAIALKNEVDNVKLYLLCILFVFSKDDSCQNTAMVPESNSNILLEDKMPPEPNPPKKIPRSEPEKKINHFLIQI